MTDPTRVARDKIGIKFDDMVDEATPFTSAETPRGLGGGISWKFEQEWCW